MRYYFLSSVILMVALWLSPCVTFSQDTLAGWTFPTGQPADTLADIHNPLNTGRSLHPAGGVNTQLTFTNGATTYAATATGWDNGMFLKCWMISFSSTGYDDLSVSSKQRSGGNNPGPRDFIIQYRIGEAGTWTDLPGGNVLVANDWSGELQNIALPPDCFDQPQIIFLRWIMTSNTSSNGDPVASTGIGKIDDIVVKGNVITGIHYNEAASDISVYPNPTSDKVLVSNLPKKGSIRVLDLTGNIICTHQNLTGEFLLNIQELPKGIYLLQINAKDGFSTNKKILKI